MKSYEERQLLLCSQFLLCGFNSFSEIPLPPSDSSTHQETISMLPV